MSVLVDTSIWIDHLNRADPGLANLLEQGLVLTHPFIVGELACGSIRNRNEIIGLLSGLPMVARADDDEILHFITSHHLCGKGLGLVDVHLLAACRIDRCKFWTRDKRLISAAEAMKIATPILF
jgi:predicted nucleic acid-binding protein